MIHSYMPCRAVGSTLAPAYGLKALGKTTRPLGRGQQLRQLMPGPGWCQAAMVRGTIGCVFFVGRARALSRLLAAVQDAVDGYARVVLVTGEAGMGKTTLVSVAAA